MNANELIANSYYLSDIVSRELETVSGSQQADGLHMLNNLLVEKSATGRKIPYYTHSSFDTIQGQEDYFVPSLIDADAVTFNIDDVRYSMVRLKRKEYFGNSRVDNIESLPGSYYVERKVGGSQIYFYDFPSDVFLVKITGKFSLSQVTGDQDLSPPLLDDFYLVYLEYALAERISNFYNIEFAPGKMKVLVEQEQNIFSVDPPDLQIKKISLFGSTGYENYAWANLGRGYVPGPTS